MKSYALLVYGISHFLLFSGSYDELSVLLHLFVVEIMLSSLHIQTGIKWKKSISFRLTFDNPKTNYGADKKPYVWRCSFMWHEFNFLELLIFLRTHTVCELSLIIVKRQHSLFIWMFVLAFYGPSNTINIMPRGSLDLLALFCGILRSSEGLTSTKYSSSSHQLSSDQQKCENGR